MDAKNGGPAFPVSTGSTVDQESGVFGHQSGNSTWQFAGMTLRDYFAAKAMVGLFNDRQYGPRDWKLAEEAYRYADLMIAARETK